MSTNQEVIFNSDQIKEIIPHRFPMLLIDKVVEMNDTTVKAIKTTTSNEWFYQGHFPEKQVMPGVLIIEALAQTGAVHLLNQEKFQGKIAYFAGIDKCRFKKQVVPGDVLELVVELTKIKGPIGKGIATCYVDGEVAASAELTFAIA